ncbi:MAG: 1,4-dihydroxy-2-naphthoate octaprenyltransferase [Verrucomicrobiae bacterium]|nr:1,4-dihydroxy-2-naphthoate octaprenyltransferase [Verrucomicrobiae bacterium]
MSQLRPWILAARPKTLPAAIVPVWVGSIPAMGHPNGFSWPLFTATLLSCLCIQIATNLFNDAIDSRKGADTAERLGPVRATAAGWLSDRAVMGGALGFCAAAAAIAIPLIQARGWPIVAIGSLSLLMAYAYTGGPVPLAYRGLGELFVILFFGFVAVIGAWFVQTGEGPGPLQWITGLQTGFYSSALIAINNLRDVGEDGSTGKRTLAVRFGKRFARGEIAVFCFVPLGLSVIAAWLLNWGGLCLPLLLLPLAVFLAVRVAKTEPGRIFNRFLAVAALQLLLFAVLFTISIFLKDG